MKKKKCFFFFQVTSPIRRYVDIVAHHQIKAHLRGQPLPMNVDEMEAMIQKQSNMNLEVFISKLNKPKK